MCPRRPSGGWPREYVGARAGRRHHRHRGRQVPAPAGGGAARQDRDQRLGRLRVLLGADGAGRARRGSRGPRRHPRDHGAAQPARPEPPGLGAAGPRRLHGAAAQPDRARTRGRARRTSATPIARWSRWPTTRRGRPRSAPRICRGSSWTVRPSLAGARPCPTSGSSTGRTRRSPTGTPDASSSSSSASRSSPPSPTRRTRPTGTRICSCRRPRTSSRCSSTGSAAPSTSSSTGSTAGWALRQPVVESPVDTRDLTDIATELAARTGLLEEYLAALNRGSGTTVPLKGDGYDYSLRRARPPDGRRDLGPRLPRRHRVAEPAAPWSATSSGSSATAPSSCRSRAKQYFLHGTMVAQGLRYELPYQERIKRVGEELGARLHERGITWWDVAARRVPAAARMEGLPGHLAGAGDDSRDGRPASFPFWLLTSRSMQYSWGSNVSLPVLADVARHVQGPLRRHAQPRRRAAARHRRRRPVEIESPTGRTEGRAILREGVRPDVAVILQQFGHWATPFARDLGMPNLNQVASMDLALTDATGSGADLVPVAIRPLRATRNGLSASWGSAGPVGPPHPRRARSARPSGGLDDALGHGHRHPALRGLPDLHHRLQAGARAARRTRRGASSPTARSASTRTCGRVFLPMQCMHCAEPPCVPVCPTGASRQRDDGIVWVRVRRLRGLRLLRDGLPLPRPPPGPRPRPATSTQPTPSEAAAGPARAPRRDDQVHLLQGAGGRRARPRAAARRGSRRHAHVRGRLHRRRHRLRRSRRCRRAAVSRLAGRRHAPSRSCPSAAPSRACTTWWTEPWRTATTTHRVELIPAQRQTPLGLAGGRQLRPGRARRRLVRHRGAGGRASSARRP